MADDPGGPAERLVSWQLEVWDGCWLEDPETDARLTTDDGSRLGRRLGKRCDVGCLWSYPTWVDLVAVWASRQFKFSNIREVWLRNCVHVSWLWLGNRLRIRQGRNSRVVDRLVSRQDKLYLQHVWSTENHSSHVSSFFSFFFIPDLSKVNSKESVRVCQQLFVHYCRLC